MPWQELPHPTAEEIASFRHGKRSRFLIDESLGSGTIEFFQYYRLNAVDVWQVGLNGHDDRAVFACAWRHRRILLTQDQDFWDDRQFPEHRNPGLVILPGANGNQTDMILRTCLDAAADAHQSPTMAKTEGSYYQRW